MHRSDTPTKVGLKLDDGVLVGFKDKVTFGLNGRHVLEYLGVPYAKPPTGKRRFKDPEPLDKPWEGELIANKKPSSCPQQDDTAFGEFIGATIWNANTTMNEDCLYLNVWVPLDEIDDTCSRPKMYRVGALGFSCLADKKIPGNLGLKDQRLALQWIQQNIIKFGGDKANVTLMGESAGAASIHYHLFSEASQNLFHKAILQSGVLFCPWAFSSVPHVVDTTSSLIKDSLSKESSNVLKADDIDRFIDNVNWQSMINSNQEYFWHVIQDETLLKRRKHLSQQSDRPTRARKPMLIGLNEDEGGTYLAYELLNVLPINQIMSSNLMLSNKQLADGISAFLRNQCTADADSKQLQTTIEQVRNVYQAETKDTGEGNRRQFIKFLGDFLFKADVYDFLEKETSSRAENSNIFLYNFTHRSQKHFWPKWTGVCHGDEIPYVFGRPFDENAEQYGVSSELSDRNFSSAIITFWTNFAKLGTPNHTNGQKQMNTIWPCYNQKDRNYLELNGTYDYSSFEASGLAVKQHDKAESRPSRKMWKDILPTLN